MNHLVILITITLAFCSFFHGSDALNCFLCNSINGSNPDCEAGGDSANRKALVSLNCRSTKGATSKNAPVLATACTTLLGEYVEERTGRILYAISRNCTGAIPKESYAKNVACGLFDTSDQIQNKGEFINGCTDLCTEDNCNSVSLGKLGQRMALKFKEYIEHTEKTASPSEKSKLRFPNVFAVAEAQQLNEAQAGKKTTSTAVTYTKSSGILLMLLLPLLCFILS